MGSTVAPLAHHVVEAQVELVKGEGLLVEHLVGVRVVLDLLGVHLEGGEDGVVEADVDAHHVEGERVGLVRLEGRGDGEAGSGVAVEDVHELLLLDRADHHGAAARVGRHKLAGHNAAAAGLAVDLGVDPLEAALIGRVLHDDDLTRVRTHDDVVAAATGEPEGSDRADNTEDLAGMDRLHLAVVIGTHELKDLAPRHNELLLLWR